MQSAEPVPEDGRSNTPKTNKRSSLGKLAFRTISGHGLAVCKIFSIPFEIMTKGFFINNHIISIFVKNTLFRLLSIQITLVMV